MAGNHVLKAADADFESEGQIGVHDHGGKGEHESGAAHVLLHAEHGGGGFQVVAAGVEHDALATERKEGGVGRGSGARPGETGDDGKAGGAGADGGDGGVFSGEVFALHEFGLNTVLGGQGLGGSGEFGGALVVGGGIDEVSREPGGAGAGEGGGKCVGAGEAGRGALGGFMSGELVGAEEPAEGGVGLVEVARFEMPICVGREREGEGAVGVGRAVGAQAHDGRGYAVLAREKVELAGGGGEASGSEEGGLGWGEGRQASLQAIGAPGVDGEGGGAGWGEGGLQFGRAGRIGWCI